MTTTKQLLLAGAVLPAIALCQPLTASAGENGALQLAQQQQPEPQKKQPGQPQPKAPPPQQQRPAGPPPAAPRPPTAQPQQAPHVPPPAAQQPPAQPRPPVAQPPQAPHVPPPAAQPQQAPHVPPPAAQPQQAPHVPPPAAQPQQAPHVPPPAAQPQQAPHVPPAAAQPQQAPHVPPAAAQPQQPPHPQPPAAQHPPTGAPGAAQQPQPHVPPPAAQQPTAPPRPPVAQPQQPSPAAPPAAQHPAAPPTPSVAQPQPGAAPHVAPGVGVGFVAPPRSNQDVEVQRRQAEEWRSRKVGDLRAERHEVHEGGRTVIQEPGRTIVQENGRMLIRHDEVERFGFGARNVHVEQRGVDTVTVIERPGGVGIVTYTGPDGRLLRRVRRYPDGREVIIIDNPVREYRDVADFYVDLPPPVIRIPRERYILDIDGASEADVYAVLTEPPVEVPDRAYSLDEIRYSRPLLERMPSVDVDTINFEFGSWTVTPDQAARLAIVADAINRAVSANPSTVFLIEGHTDAVGSDVDNLSLSDRRAEAVAMVLSEQFQVPPENLTTQGYGKQYLKIPTDAPERRNRRVTVRNITPLLVGQR
jgi:outer membrane protein OmpA-like peptidoglycan-associated protein